MKEFFKDGLWLHVLCHLVRFTQIGVKGAEIQIVQQIILLGILLIMDKAGVLLVKL